MISTLSVMQHTHAHAKEIVNATLTEENFCSSMIDRILMISHDRIKSRKK